MDAEQARQAHVREALAAQRGTTTRHGLPVYHENVKAAETVIRAFAGRLGLVCERYEKDCGPAREHNKAEEQREEAHLRHCGKKDASEPCAVCPRKRRLYTEYYQLGYRLSSIDAQPSGKVFLTAKCICPHRKTRCMGCVLAITSVDYPLTPSPAGAPKKRRLQRHDRAIKTAGKTTGDTNAGDSARQPAPKRVARTLGYAREAKDEGAGVLFASIGHALSCRAPGASPMAVNGKAVAILVADSGRASLDFSHIHIENFYHHTPERKMPCRAPRRRDSEASMRVRARTDRRQVAKLATDNMAVNITGASPEV